MEPQNSTLASLFEGNRVYVVPNYQRLYVWNRDDQWAPLWLDVEDIANDLLGPTFQQNSNNIDLTSVESHFLGAVVLKMSGYTPDLSQQLRVIDGQQRLTTLQLLVAAAITALHESECQGPAERLSLLAANSSRADSSSVGKYKITHGRHRRGHDYERFGEVMAAALRGDTDSSILGPMADCYRFFLAKVRNWLLRHSHNVDTAASALVSTIMVKLHVVAIYLGPHEKEHIIFETLNARGEPLTEWDKIKNYLLYKSDIEPNMDQEQFFEDFLDGFDQPWWRQPVGRGAQRRPRTDVFADYWLESRMRTPVAVRRVFREFQKHVDGDDQSLKEIAQRLVRDAHYFKTYEGHFGSTDTREVLFHSRRRAMSLGAFWPLLLQLQRMDARQQEREAWLAVLESYFIRRLITGHQARSYDQIALELLRVISTSRSASYEVGPVIVDYLSGLARARRWPTDEEVRRAVLSRYLSRNARRLVLMAVEGYLIQKRSAGNEGLSSAVQVEHIMPVGWKPDSWPLPGSVEPTEAVARRTEVIGTLGNLTLLNGRLNAAISNARWERKQAAIQRSDNLFLNRHLLQSWPERWTELDIEHRGQWLHELIIEIWPRGLYE